jgi:hypothetical protein
MKKGITVVLPVTEGANETMILYGTGSINSGRYYTFTGKSFTGIAQDPTDPANDAFTAAAGVNRAIVIKSLSVYSEDPTGAETLTAQLRVNGANAAVVAVLHGGNTFAVDNAHSAAVPQGQLFAVSLTNSGGSASTNAIVAIEFT